jgi:hypothetical protein
MKFIEHQVQASGLEDASMQELSGQDIWLTEQASAALSEEAERSTQAIGGTPWRVGKPVGLALAAGAAAFTGIAVASLMDNSAQAQECEPGVALGNLDGNLYVHSVAADCSSTLLQQITPENEAVLSTQHRLSRVFSEWSNMDASLLPADPINQGDRIITGRAVLDFLKSGSEKSMALAMGIDKKTSDDWGYSETVFQHQVVGFDIGGNTLRQITPDTLMYYGVSSSEIYSPSSRIRFNADGTVAAIKEFQTAPRRTQDSPNEVISALRTQNGYLLIEESPEGWINVSEGATSNHGIRSLDLPILPTFAPTSDPNWWVMELFDLGCGNFIEKYGVPFREIKLPLVPMTPTPVVPDATPTVTLYVPEAPAAAPPPNINVSVNVTVGIVNAPVNAPVFNNQPYNAATGGSATGGEARAGASANAGAEAKVVAPAAPQPPLLIPIPYPVPGHRPPNPTIFLPEPTPTRAATRTPQLVTATATSSPTIFVPFTATLPATATNTQEPATPTRRPTRTSQTL